MRLLVAFFFFTTLFQCRFAFDMFAFFFIASHLILDCTFFYYYHLNINVVGYNSVGFIILCTERTAHTGHLYHSLIHYACMYLCMWFCVYFCMFEPFCYWLALENSRDIQNVHGLAYTFKLFLKQKYRKHFRKIRDKTIIGVCTCVCVLFFSFASTVLLLLLLLLYFIQFLFENVNLFFSLFVSMQSAIFSLYIWMPVIPIISVSAFSALMCMYVCLCNEIIGRNPGYNERFLEL